MEALLKPGGTTGSKISFYQIYQAVQEAARGPTRAATNPLQPQTVLAAAFQACWPPNLLPSSAAGATADSSVPSREATAAVLTGMGLPGNGTAPAAPALQGVAAEKLKGGEGRFAKAAARAAAAAAAAAAQGQTLGTALTEDVQDEEMAAEADDDPTAMMHLASFAAMADPDADDAAGDGSMAAQLRSVYSSGGAIVSDDGNQDKGPSAGGSGSGSDNTAPKKNAASQQLTEQVKGAVEDGKGKMKDAFTKTLGEFLGEDSPLMGIWNAVKEEAAEKLADAHEAVAEAKAAVGLPPNGNKPSSKAAGTGPPPSTEPLEPPHTQDVGPSPWLGGLPVDLAGLRDSARQFAQEHILPHCMAWDANRVLPRKMYRQAGRSGYCAMYCSKLAGGKGMSYMHAATVFEVLGAADPSSTSYLAQQNMVSFLMDKFSSPPLRMSMTRALASGLVLGTYAMSEHLSGSQPLMTATFAVMFKDQSGTYWLLNGAKNFVTLGGSADLYLVAARTSPNPKGGISYFLLPKGYPGMSFVTRYQAIGGRCVPVKTMILVACIVRDEFVVAKEKALQCTKKAMAGFRVCLASAAAGAARLCVSYCHEFLRRRGSLGHSILQNQWPQHQLAAWSAEVEGARLLVRHAAFLLDSKAPDAAAQAAMAKRHATDTALRIATAATALLGGAGLLDGCPLNKIARDMAVYSVLGGVGNAVADEVWQGLLSKRTGLPCLHVAPAGMEDADPLAAHAGHASCGDVGVDCVSEDGDALENPDEEA